MKSIPFLLMLVFCLTAHGIAEQISLDDCIQEALANNPTLHHSQARWEAADANATYAARQRLPQIGLQASYRHLSDVDPFEVDIPLPNVGTVTISEPILNTYSAGVTVQQPLFTGFRLKHQADMTRRQAEAEQEQVAADRATLIFDVTQAYYQLLQAQENERVIIESLDAMQAHLNDVQNMFDTGLATRNDVLQVEVLVSNTRIRLNQAEMVVAMAEEGLRNLLARDDRAPLTIADSLNVQPREVGALDDLLQQAYGQRPELKALHLQQQAADHGVGLAKSGYFPTIMAVGSFQYAQPHPRYQPPEEEFNEDWQVGIVAEFTPFDWGKTSQKVRQARALERQLAAQNRQVQQGIRVEVTDAYLRHGEAMSRLELVAVTVAQAAENLQVARDQYRNGMSTNADVLDAETNLLRAKLDQTKARIDYVLAEARLERVVGAM